ncbi:MAG: sulfatase-like hydrolase/transferase [Solirubrobacterales bacterium]|nr:sulfatase-like hydrolase/transferase [Solirubrobacterales bacterium]
MTEAIKSAGRPERPSLLLGGAHLLALWVLAMVQPMLSLLGSNPEFFVARGNTAGQIIAYVFIWTLGPPLLALALEALARLINRDLQWGLHLLLMTLTGGAFLLHLLKDWLSWPAGLLIALSLLVAAAGVYATTRWRFPRSFMDILTIAPLVVLPVFFFFTPTSRLILPREQPEPVAAKVSRPVPVVMVIVDELPLSSLETPDGEIDASRFPAFAEIADHSTWYRNATGAAAYTPMAVPALFAGQEPSHDDLPIAADYPRSIFTLLGGSYRMNVMESATRICPEKLCPNEPAIPTGSLDDLFSDLWIASRYLLLPDSLTRNLPDITQTFNDFGNAPEDDSATTGTTDEVQTSAPGALGEEGATGTSGQFRSGQGGARRLGRLFTGKLGADELVRVERFNRDLKPGQDRTLDLIHIEKPHYPWRHIPAGQRYSILASEWSGLLPNDGAWQTWGKVTDIALQRHLLETGYTDTLLGRIINRLKATGLWDRAMVIVAADHGAAFTPKVQRRTAEPGNLGQIASVPLFVKAPGQTRPRQVERHTCATQVLGLISDQLGIEYPWKPADCPPDRVTVLNSPTGQASGSLVRVVRQRNQMISRIARLFGTGGGWQPVYQFGPWHEQLIGRRVRDLTVNPSRGPYEVSPERPNQVKEYRPDRPTLFGLLQRGGTRKIGSNRVLAVAVDGKIEAVGVTFKDGIREAPGYSILLPPDSLKAGFNRVDIYLVEDQARRLRLLYDGSRPIPPDDESGQN